MNVEAKGNEELKNKPLLLIINDNYFKGVDIS